MISISYAERGCTILRVGSTYLALVLSVPDRHCHRGIVGLDFRCVDVPAACGKGCSRNGLVSAGRARKTTSPTAGLSLSGFSRMAASEPRCSVIVMSAAWSPWVFLVLSDVAGKSGAAYGRGRNAPAFGLPVLPPSRPRTAAGL